MERIETTILRNLVFNEEFARKTIPFIEPDFFEQRTDKILFEEIVSFITKYDTCATLEALNIEVENRTDLTAEEVKQINDTSKELNDSPVDNQWLLDITEKWCRDRAIYLALMESIHIADGEDNFKWQLDLIGPGDEHNLTWSNLFINCNYIPFLENYMPVFNIKPIVMIVNKNADIKNWGLPFETSTTSTNCVATSHCQPFGIMCDSCIRLESAKIRS